MSGRQFDYVWLSARAMHPHVGPQHVWCLTAYRNQENTHPKYFSVLFEDHVLALAVEL